MDLLSIPGYALAVLTERTVRDASFLGITESVGPFEVLPMTLRHWMVLRVMGSPLLKPASLDGSSTPTPDGLRDFLWLLSPQFDPARHSRAKTAFCKRCEALFYPPRYLALWNTERARRRHIARCEDKLAVAAQIIHAARAYVAETMQDRPPVIQSLIHGFEADYFSDAAFFCARFGREYGWSQEETLNTPLKRIFQYLTEMKQHHGSKVPMCNPSDRVKAAWVASLNEQRRASQ